MTPDQFLSWISDRDERYELIRGTPCRSDDDPMTEDIVAGLTGTLIRQLKIKPSRIFTGRIMLQTGPTTLRSAALGIDRPDGTDDPHHPIARRPVLVAEVLSPTTDPARLDEKFAEYRSVPDLRYILVPTMLYCVRLSSRAEDDTWTDEIFKGPESVVGIPELGLDLQVADIYGEPSHRATPRP